MNWSSWSEFFAMGGYGLYVWGSFGVVALAVAAEIGTLAARRRALAAPRRAESSNAFANEAPHEA